MSHLARIGLVLVLGVLAALALQGGPAGAERIERGNLIVSLDGGISPHQLPRQRHVPVAVHLAGRVLTSDHSPIPRVNWIRLELAWRGVLDTRGLPVCPRLRLRGTDDQQALEACPGAAVGRGSLFAQIFVPNQPAFDVRARLIAFNGRTAAHRHAVLVHAYSTRPPVSFVIPFSVHREKGGFRTVLVALIRRSAGPWPHIANFSVRIARTFNHEGQQRSYLRASCPVPKGFTAGFLSFARATYAFEGGRELTTESVRSCSAERSRPGRHGA